MTMWADKGMSIQTVIVIVGDTVVGYLLFQPVRKDKRFCEKDRGLQLQAWHSFIQMPSCKGARAPLDPLHWRLCR